MARFGIVVCLLFLASSAFFTATIHAQSVPNGMSGATMTGAPPYSTHETVREDLALSTGGLHVYIPLVSLKGKGGQTFNLGWAYDSHGINLEEFDQSNGWTDESGTLYPYVYADWVVSPDVLGYITVPHLRASRKFLGNYNSTGCTQGPCENYSLFCTTNFTFRDEYGTSYSFEGGGYAVARDCSYTGSNNEGQLAHTIPVGNSGQTLDVKLDTTNPNDIVVWTKDGTAYHFPPVTTWPPGTVESGNDTLLYYDYNFVKIVDPNGNTITNSGTAITDSVGNTISLSPLSWKDSNGVQQTVTFGTAAAGPVAPPNPTTCQFTNQFQIQHQTQYIWGTDLANLPTFASGLTLTFPGGSVYTLQFDQLAQLTKISYPGGGYTRYDFYDTDPQFSLGGLTCQASYREVSAKHVCSSTSGSCTANTEATTTYTQVQAPQQGSNLQTDVVDPMQNRVRYNFFNEDYNGTTVSATRETDRFIYQGNSTLVKTIHTDYAAPGNSQIPTAVTTTLNDVSPALVSKVVTTYDTISGIAIDNPTEIDEYDFDGTLKGKTTGTWEKTGNYTIATGHILDRPATKTVTDQATGNYTTTTYGYDTIGNLLTTTVTGTNVASALTTYTRNTYGDVTSVTDPKMNLTQYGYASPWIDTACAQGVDSSGHPSSITNALSQITNYKYYSCTGMLATVTDPNPNSQVTTYTYDSLGRITETQYPDGGQTTKTYVDTEPQSITTTVKVTSGVNKTIKSLTDGLGHEIQTQLTTDPEGTDYTDTTYDALERVSTVSNPHRTGSLPTDGMTTHIYDELGRVCVVVPPDGTAVANSTCPTTAPVGDVFTTYAGNCTTVIDEAGKARKSCVDGLGRMTGVWEDPNNLDYETDYAYDGFINLTSVTQRGGAASGSWRTRSFVYDGLSRLTKATNPESGAISYTYDLDNNVATKIAPKPNQTLTATVTTTYTYDKLNRLTKKSYSDGTATPQYGYDGVAIASGCTTAPPGDTDSYPIGRRTAMCDGSGATSWIHDQIGRVTQERRIIGRAAAKYINYTYNLDGSLFKLTTPPLKTIVYTQGGAGRTLSVVDSTDNINFATSALYAPPGELTSMVNGLATGFAGFTTTNSYNKLLQPVILSAASPSATVLSLSYNFNLGSGDNGNVIQIVNNRDNTRTQNFMYDSLNRIQQAYSSGTQWGETFSPTTTSPGVAPTISGIDGWGNLTNRSGVTGKTMSEGLSCSANASNQLNTCYNYDAAGNLIQNGSATYTYDAENRLTSTSGYTYVYDGNGERVEKCNVTPCPTSGTNGTLYWKGTGSQTLDESDLSGNALEEYIFFNGQRVARRDVATNLMHYYFSDHLGSHGVVESATGTTCEQDIDYYPYGGVEHDYCPNTAQNYKFTGKERDTESGLDNFGARYNASTMGRFMSPDWSAKVEPVPYSKLDDPQTLNLYAYVGNNPLIRVDKDGHYYCSGTKSQCQDLKDALANIKQAASNDSLSGKERGALNKVLSLYGDAEKSQTDKTKVVVGFAKGNADGGAVMQWGVVHVTLSFGMAANNVSRSGVGSVDTEEAAQTTHEGEHGVQEQDHGNPLSRVQEQAGEHDAYKVQSFVNKGLEDDSPYGVWTQKGGYSDSQVNKYATGSTNGWCNAGGSNCQ